MPPKRNQKPSSNGAGNKATNRNDTHRSSGAGAGAGSRTTATAKPNGRQTHTPGQSKREPQSQMTKLLSLEIYQQLLDVFTEGLCRARRSPGLATELGSLTLSPAEEGLDGSTMDGDGLTQISSQTTCSDTLVTEISKARSATSDNHDDDDDVDGREQSFYTTVQTIKSHLFARDFDAAFGEPSHLPVYAARWSASRALGYVSVLVELGDELGLTRRPPAAVTTTTAAAAADDDDDKTREGKNEDGDGEEDDPLTKDAPAERIKVLCLGAGSGSEYVAFVGWAIEMGRRWKKHQSGPSNIDLRLVDMAAWGNVLESLRHGVETVVPDRRSEHSSSSSAVSDTVSFSFLQADVLGPSTSSSSSSSLPSTTTATAISATTPPFLDPAPSLVTLCFTLNELFAASKARTIRLLLDISKTIEPGGRLLVIDSPGSYGTVAVGKTQHDGDADSRAQEQKPEQRAYQMAWMLDYTLLVLAPKMLDPQDEGGESGRASSKFSQPRRPKGVDDQPRAVWRKIRSEDSRWFRVPDGLKYGTVPLENMRMQVHVFERCRT